MLKRLIATFATFLLVVSNASAQATTPPSLGNSLIQMFFALAGVIAILFLFLWALKKLTTQRGSAAGLLRVVAATAVGTRERVVVLEIGSMWLVLGVAQGHVSALAEIPRQPAIEQPATTKPAPPHWLQKLLNRLPQR